MEDDGKSYLQMRDGLYRHFQNSGLITNLKTQLRSQVLGKLKGNPAAKKSIGSPGLIKRAVHSLVAEFLSTENLHHTLSVFIPETGLFPGGIEGRGRKANLDGIEKQTTFGLTSEDLEGLLKLHAEVEGEKHVSMRIKEAEAVTNATHRKSKLEALIEGFATRPGRAAHVSSYSQTTEELHPEYNAIDWKLKKVDEKYQTQLEKENALPYLTMEERMQKYRRDTDARAKKEIQDEVERIRATQISQMRVEERMRYRRELEVVQSQIEDMYKERLTELREKEERMQNDLKRKSQIAEDSAFKHRQRALDDMERLRAREEVVRRNEIDHEKRTQLESERLTQKALNLERQMTEVIKSRREMDTALRQAVAQAKAEKDREWETKMTKGAEARLADAKLIQQMRDDLKSERKRLEGFRGKVAEAKNLNFKLEVQLKEAKNQQNSLNSAITDRNSAIDTLKKEGALDKSRLERYGEKVGELQNQLACLKAEGEKARKVHMREVEKKEEENRKLEKQAIEERKGIAHRAAQTIAKQKIDFERRQMLWEKAVIGLRKRLGLKSRQQEVLDREREADKAKIHQLKMTVDNLKRALNSHFPTQLTYDASYRPISINSATQRRPFSQPTRPLKAAPQGNTAYSPPQWVDDQDGTMQDMELEEEEAKLLRATEQAEENQKKLFQGASRRRNARGRKSWHPTSMVVHRKQVRPKPNLMRSITSSAATSANLNTSKRKFPRPPPRTDRRNESGDMEGPVEGAVEGPVKGILGFVDKKEEAGSTGEAGPGPQDGNGDWKGNRARDPKRELGRRQGQLTDASRAGESHLDTCQGQDRSKPQLQPRLQLRSQAQAQAQAQTQTQAQVQAPPEESSRSVEDPAQPRSKVPPSSHPAASRPPAARPPAARISSLNLSDNLLDTKSNSKPSTEAAPIPTGATRTSSKPPELSQLKLTSEPSPLESEQSEAKISEPLKAKGESEGISAKGDSGGISAQTTIDDSLEKDGEGEKCIHNPTPIPTQITDAQDSAHTHAQPNRYQLSQVESGGTSLQGSDNDSLDPLDDRGDGNKGGWGVDWIDDLGGGDDF
ncbi:hypothetical protein AAMO2058_000562800 [Amorphochlora amoebiformis]